jgi:Flp pilus assembly protein TadD
MKKTIPTLAILLAIIVISLNRYLENREVLKASDLSSFIDTEAEMDETNNEVAFWSEKLENQKHSVTYKLKLASELSKRFRAEGNINDLLKSDSLLKSSLSAKLGLVSVYHSLSANAITQHQFKAAWNYANEALKLGEKKDVSYFLLFDASMELGSYSEASSYLNKQKNQNTFDYLSRKAKLADKNGNLEEAISLMEKASDRVKDNPEMRTWALSNLADMYGHQGEIEKAYTHYLKVLDHNPTHYHSLKGLAWIAFSHDYNTSAAKEILAHVEANTNDPQVKLLMAEISEFEQDEELQSAWTKSYYQQVASEPYSRLYSKYLILIEAEDQPQKAIKRATTELENRSTPEVYAWLAWAHSKNNQHKEALQLISEHVIGNSFEPEILYFMGVIYKNNNMKTKGDKLLKEALESRFELGPVTTEKIKKALMA